VIEVLGDTPRLHSREIIEAVNARLLAFKAGAPQSDDVTMVCVRRTNAVCTYL
jgi:serine phosphatase RsbU (regulator of sigma subunit)